MRTFGLGGDSEVHFVSQGLQGGVTLGPRRVLPVACTTVTRHRSCRWTQLRHAAGDYAVLYAALMSLK